MDGQGTNWHRNIAENFNRLSRAHERYRQTDRRQTDGRTDGRRHIGLANMNLSSRSLKMDSQTDAHKHVACITIRLWEEQCINFVASESIWLQCCFALLLLSAPLWQEFTEMLQGLSLRNFCYQSRLLLQESLLAFITIQRSSDHSRSTLRGSDVLSSFRKRLIVFMIIFIHQKGRKTHKNK